MDTLLQAQMLAERCKMYLNHLRGLVYLLHGEAQNLKPGAAGEEWQNLMKQILHLAENTEREVTHYHQTIKSKKPAAEPAFAKPVAVPVKTSKAA